VLGASSPPALSQRRRLGDVVAVDLEEHHGVLVSEEVGDLLDGHSLGDE